MNVGCWSCAAKYMVPDEKVRGRKVRMKCKRCGAAIILDGTRDPPVALKSSGAGASKPPGARSSAAPPKTASSAPPAQAGFPAPAQRAAPPDPAPETRPAAPVPAAAARPAPGTRPAAPVPATAARPAPAPRPASTAVPRPQRGTPTATASRTAPETPLPDRPHPTREDAGAAGGADSRPAWSPQPRVSSGHRDAASTRGKTILGLAAPVQPVAPRQPEPEAAPPPAPAAAPEEDAELWTVAVTEEDQRDVSLDQVVQLYADGVIDPETFVWREGMEDWLTPFEIPEIAQALRKRGIASPGAATEKAGPAPEPAGRDEEVSGSWHEPGRWGAGGPLAADEGDVSFDDVTVAMAAPKAQELLEAAAASARGSTPPPPSEDEATTVATAGELGLDAAAPEDEPGIARAPSLLPFERPGDEASAAPASGRAALRSERGAGVDLFAGAASAGQNESAAPRQQLPSLPPETAPAPDASRTGARNESSVLFTLEALSKAPSPPVQPSPEPEADWLAAPAAPAPAAPEPSAGAAPGPALATPDFTAPVVPSSAAAASAERSGGRGGWLAVFLLLLVLLAGAGYYVYFVNPDVVRALIG